MKRDKPKSTYCETLFHLNIAQHKGLTYIRWSDTLIERQVLTRDEYEHSPPF